MTGLARARRPDGREVEDEIKQRVKGDHHIFTALMDSASDRLDSEAIVLPPASVIQLNLDSHA
jgi:hypothetical protein